MEIIIKNVTSNKITFLQKFIIRSLLIFWGCYSTFSGEITDIFEGYGTDGFTYGYFTYDLEDRIKKKDFPHRLYARILPLACVHYSTEYIAGSSYKIDKTFNLGEYKVPFSKALLYGFKIYNLCIFFIMIYVCHLIAQKLNMNSKGDLMIFGFLFFNFYNLKQFFFEPVMLDPSIFLHGLLLFYAIITRNNIVLIIVTITGFFINEASAIIGLILCGFTFSPNYIKFEIFQKGNLKWITALFSVAYGLTSIYLYYYPLCHYSDENKTIGFLLPVSIFTTILFFYFTTLRLLSIFFNNNSLLELWKQFMGWRFVLLLILLIIIRLASFQLSDKLAYPICDNQDFSIISYILSIVRLSSSRPGGFLVAHFVYMGPAIIFSFIFLRKILSFLSSYGYGIGVAISIMLFHFINTESRQCILGFIFLVIPLAAVLQDNLSWPTVIIILITLLLISRFYIPLNPLGTELYIKAIQDEPKLLFLLPLQKYMMNLGPWMSDKYYLLWLPPTIVTMIGAIWFKKYKFNF